MNSPQRHERVYQLFLKARELDVTARSAMLAESCADDSSLREEVEVLLAQQSDPFLEESPVLGQRAAKPSIDGYEILREVAHGGMGTVYLAHDARLDRQVALKTIRAELRTPEHLGVLRREARLVARLRHPNIVSVHAFEDSSDPPYMIMEWVQGSTLNEAFRKSGLEDNVRLLLKVARALQYAHDKRVIHRDLKPDNIIVDQDREPRLLDFGLAKVFVRPSESLSIKGTPLYMAPEQFTDPREVGPAADIFALGLLLYELLVNARPPVPEDPGDLRSWADRRVPVPRDLNPDVSEVLQRVCLKACEREIEERYSSAGQFADDLERYLNNRPVRTRPKRYDELLTERMQDHMDAVASWEADRLVTRREADRLLNHYTTLMASEAVGDPEGRRLRLGAALMQIGGWLIVLSAVLWVYYYWEQLSSIERIAAIGGPAVFINLAAEYLWPRTNRLVALIFLAVGVLLIPLGILVLLSESGLLSMRMKEESDLLADFTNRQLVVASWSSLIYAAVLLCRRRYAILSTVTMLLLALSAVSMLLLLGLKEWVRSQELATAAAAFLPLPVLSYIVAIRMDRRSGQPLSIPFYGLAFVGLLIILLVLAYDGPISWLRLDRPSASGVPNHLRIGREIGFMICGIICLGLAWAQDRVGSRVARQWGGMYYRFVPALCLIPLDLMSTEPMFSLGLLGNSELYALVLLVPALCIGVFAIGVHLQLKIFAYYGLAHLSTFLIRFTGRHLEECLSWPLVMVGIGATSMAIGLRLETRRRSN